MRKLEFYAENPFGGIRFGRDLTVEFFGDMTNRPEQAVLNGAPFAELVEPTRLTFSNLQSSHSATVTSKTQLKSQTLTVDQIIALLKEKIPDNEALVLTRLKKNSPEYLRFFPNGRSGYNNVTKGNIDTLMDQAFDNLLAIARRYKGKGGQIKTFFDMITITADQYVAPESIFYPFKIPGRIIIKRCRTPLKWVEKPIYRVLCRHGWAMSLS